MHSTFLNIGKQLKHPPIIVRDLKLLGKDYPSVLNWDIDWHHPMEAIKNAVRAAFPENWKENMRWQESPNEIYRRIKEQNSGIILKPH